MKDYNYRNERFGIASIAGSLGYKRGDVYSNGDPNIIDGFIYNTKCSLVFPLVFEKAENMTSNYSKCVISYLVITPKNGEMLKTSTTKPYYSATSSDGTFYSTKQRTALFGCRFYRSLEDCCPTVLDLFGLYYFYNDSDTVVSLSDTVLIYLKQRVVCFRETPSIFCPTDSASYLVGLGDINGIMTAGGRFTPFNDELKDGNYSHMGTSFYVLQ